MGGATAAAAATKPGRRILVAVDEGDESVQALRWCLGTFAAASRGDTVILLYVRPPPPAYSVLDASGTCFSIEICVCRLVGFIISPLYVVEKLTILWRKPR
jgi:hypothetical protein